MKNPPSFLLLSFLTIVLTACLPGGTTFSPERAVTQELIQNHSAVLETIHIHQNQLWHGNKIFLVSFTSIEQNQKYGCEGVFELVPATISWRMSSSGIGCSSPPNTDPITYGSGTQGMAPDGYSYSYGLITLSEAKWVLVTWDDGVDQRIPVINGSYLALRENIIQTMPIIQVFNEDEEVINSRP